MSALKTADSCRVCIYFKVGTGAVFSFKKAMLIQMHLKFEHAENICDKIKVVGIVKSQTK